mgnify:CR=1 FL=1
MVVATAAMPRPDWRKARVLAWTTALLHFDKSGVIVPSTRFNGFVNMRVLKDSLQRAGVVRVGLTVKTTGV